MLLYTSKSYFKDIADVCEIDSGVEAGQDIPQGTLLLYALPAIVCPKYEMLSSVCHYCYRSFSKLSCCSKCRLIRYCSKECQKADWNFHKQECKYLTKLSEMETQTPSKLLVWEILVNRFSRALSQVFQDFSSTACHYSFPDEYSASYPTCLCDAIKGDFFSSEFNQNALSKFLSYVNVISSQCKCAVRASNKPSLEKAYSAFRRHRISITTVGKEIADAFYPFIYYLRKEYHANTCYTFRNHVLLLYANTDIKKGEMITFPLTNAYVPQLVLPLIYIERCIKPEYPKIDNSKVLAGVICSKGHPISITYENVIQWSKKFMNLKEPFYVTCIQCRSPVKVPFIYDVEGVPAMDTHLTEFDQLIEQGYSRKDAYEQYLKWYTPDCYLNYLACLRCRDYYIKRGDFEIAVMFCKDCCNYSSTYLNCDDRIVLNDMIILANCFARYGNSDLAMEVMDKMQDRLQKSLVFNEEDKNVLADFKSTLEFTDSIMSYIQSF